MSHTHTNTYMYYSLRNRASWIGPLVGPLHLLLLGLGSKYNPLQRSLEKVRVVVLLIKQIQGESSLYKTMLITFLFQAVAQNRLLS